MLSLARSSPRGNVSRHRFAASFMSTRFLHSWISSCSPWSTHFCPFLCSPPTGRKRIRCATGKIHLKEADTKSDSSCSRDFTLRVLDAAPVQVDRLSTRCTRRVPFPAKKGEGCVPSTNRRAREAGRGRKAQRIIAGGWTAGSIHKPILYVTYNFYRFAHFEVVRQLLHSVHFNESLSTIRKSPYYDVRPI